MLTVEKLNAFGANTQEGLSRCFGNEALYLKLVSTVPGEDRFDVLQTSVKAGDLKAGFEAAHALKGVLGNLSLTPLYDPMVEITEDLRTGKEKDYSAILEEIASKRSALREICD